MALTHFRSHTNLLAEHLRPQTGSVILLAILLFGDLGLRLISPQIIRQFIDAVPTSNRQTLTYIAILFIMVSVSQQVLAVCVAYVSGNVTWGATNSLRSRLAQHCLYLDMNFHNSKTPGEMIERIDGDINALDNFFSQFVIQILGNVILMLGIVILLFVEDWRAGIGLLGFAILGLLIALHLRRVAIVHMKANREASANMFSFLEECLVGSEDIRSNRTVPYVLRRFYELTRSRLTKEMKSGYMINILSTSSVLIGAIGNATALGIGAYLYQTSVFSIGTVYMLFHYTNMLSSPIGRITDQIEDLQRASASIERVSDLLAIQPALKSGREDTLPKGAFAAVFRNVTFGYVADEPVLHKLNFVLQPGRALGVLGRTGSGKTTLARLLLRLYDPWEGQVYVGKTNVRHVDLSELRYRIAMVTQNVQLFQASIRDNLTLFDDRISDKRIHKVVSDLGLTDWLESLSSGLDTELAFDGGSVSAGEAQLLAFARVFLLKKPDMVILDEASSRLDPATEQYLEQAVERLINKRTVIVIAHQLATVQRVDDIMILNEGRIVEYGPREKLEADITSRFANLLSSDLEDVLV